MRRALAIGLILLLALAGFYVAWPAWTAFQIRQAIEANDPSALERKVDFVSVRARARPIVAAQMQKSLDELQREAGSFGAAITGQLRDSLGARFADAAVDSILTPANVVRLVRQGENLSRALKDITNERTADIPAGGAAPPASAPGTGTGTDGQPAAGKPRRQLTIDNIKTYRITGPLNIEVGVALDQTDTLPDAVAELAFTGGGWKVVAIVPRL